MNDLAPGSCPRPGCTGTLEVIAYTGTGTAVYACSEQVRRRSERAAAATPAAEHRPASREHREQAAALLRSWREAI